MRFVSTRADRLAGVSLRTAMLEGLAPEEIVKRELATGVPVVYRLKPDSRPQSVETLTP